jgi:hypothetical protein
LPGTPRRQMTPASTSGWSPTPPPWTAKAAILLGQRQAEEAKRPHVRHDFSRYRIVLFNPVLRRDGSGPFPSVKQSEAAIRGRTFAFRKTGLDRRAQAVYPIRGTSARGRVFC